MNIAVVGLGYVGLPLAVEMSSYFKTVGFDINCKRIEIIQSGKDPNGEVSEEKLRSCSLTVSSDPSVLNDCDFIIVSVPTPIDSHKTPDLTPVIKASETVGKHIKKDSTVVFESTVYPGVTEDICVPVLERSSGLVWKKDFFVGYSPERINPGDKVHTFANITKIVSGDTQETLEKVASVYGIAVKAGVYRAESIKVAEAAKVIENTQRDINIALMNELKIIFDKMDISTKAVLKAAGTKWNFLPFQPGLVGGHCIGVDPYYLVYKAEEIGHHPQIISFGRRINDDMGKYFADNLVKKMIHGGKIINKTNVLICGITFKENCPDIRNSRVIDIIVELENFGVNITVWDPKANPDDVEEIYGITMVKEPKIAAYDSLLLAVKHNEFIELGREGLEKFITADGFLYDIKEAL